MLESIRSQSFQDYEVVVVNSGADEISDLVREYGFREIRGKGLKLSRPGIWRALRAEETTFYFWTRPDHSGRARWRCSPPTFTTW